MWPSWLPSRMQAPSLSSFQSSTSSHGCLWAPSLLSCPTSLLALQSGCASLQSARPPYRSCIDFYEWLRIWQYLTQDVRTCYGSHVCRWKQREMWRQLSHWPGSCPTSLCLEAGPPALSFLTSTPCKCAPMPPVPIPTRHHLQLSERQTALLQNLHMLLLHHCGHS